MNGSLNSSKNKALSRTCAASEQCDEVRGFQNRIERAMLILGKSPVANNGCERSMSANSIPGRLQNLPFTREHVPMRDLVVPVAQINARHGFFLNIG